MVVTGRLGKAVVELDLDDKNFKRETGQATAGLDSQMKSLQTTVMGVVGALGLVAAAKGAVNMLTTLTKKAIEVADSFEVMEKQLITLTKSEDKARRFFEEIKNFAKGTPYQVRDLAQSFNMLYPVFKDETIPMMKLIGDTAAGTGRSFEDTASAMMRMATGDWGVEIMRQLFLVKSDFGDLFGPNGELVGSQEEAWAKLEEILGGRFGGMMSSMMDTVSGKVSNLKDVIDSLANSVGAELTPIAKELLDLLIEVVKEAEASGELRAAAADFAEVLSENKDTLKEIVTDLVPRLVDALVIMIESLSQVVELLGNANNILKTGFGEDAPTAVDIFNEMLKNTLTVIQLLIMATEQWIERMTFGAYKARTWAEISAPPAIAGEVKLETGAGLHGRVKGLLESGMSPAEIEAYARGMGASEADIAYAYEEYNRLKKAPPPGGGGKKGKARRDGRLTEEELYDMKSAARERVRGFKDLRKTALGIGTVEQAGLSPEELKKQRQEELDRVRELAEMYGEYLDPTRYIIEGLKSGEMKQAIQDFAVELGTRVSEELLRKLIVMGIMAILNMLTGGGAQGVTAVMGKGGIIKAASGLLGTFPAIPGGWYMPFGNDLVNFSEAGQAETLGVFPPGRRGQDLITGPLARMFNIPVMPGNVMVNPNVAAPNVNVETRNNNNVTVRVTNTDRHHIGASVSAERGKVNKAVTVRQ